MLPPHPTSDLQSILEIPTKSRFASCYGRPRPPTTQAHWSSTHLKRKKVTMLFINDFSSVTDILSYWCPLQISQFQSCNETAAVLNFKICDLNHPCCRTLSLQFGTRELETRFHRACILIVLNSFASCNKHFRNFTTIATYRRSNPY